MSPERDNAGIAYLEGIMPGSAGRLTRDRPLSGLSWLRVGGVAEWFYQPAGITDLQEFLRGLPGSVPVFVLGAGSNVIIRDGGVPGVVIRLGKPFAAISASENRIKSGAAMPVARLAQQAADLNLDLAFLRTIPGTLGGAVRMNAGCYESYIADRLLDATVVSRDGVARKAQASEMGFGYRRSGLARDDIVVEATLECEPRERDALLKEMERYLEHRSSTQPTGIRTAGSTFRNPAGRSSAYGDADQEMQSAWKLIDEAGLRGYRHGDAQVSQLHPNFLVNLGLATAADMERLGEHVRATVLRKHGIRLDWEVDRVGVCKGDPEITSTDTGGA